MFSRPASTAYATAAVPANRPWAGLTRTIMLYPDVARTSGGHLHRRVSQWARQRN